MTSEGGTDIIFQGIGVQDGLDTVHSKCSEPEMWDQFILICH